MMFTRYFFLVVLIFSLKAAVAQTQYYVGTGIESIEPDSSVFALTLAGYGAPRDGRFSLGWKDAGKCPPLKAITGFNKKFYAVDLQDALLEGALSGDTIAWRRTTQGHQITAIAAGHGKLFATNARNELLVSEPGKNDEWIKTGNVAFAVALTFVHDRLYGVNERHELFVVDAPETKPVLRKLGDAGNVISMASQGDMIYALRNDNTIWRTNTGSNAIEWVKAARQNGSTYNTAIRQITVMDNRLYGVGAENGMYRGFHSSRGDLYSTAMAIRVNNKTAVIVGVDLTGATASLVDGVKQVIAQRRNIPPEAILINISHTHFAPVTMEWPAWPAFAQKPDTTYLHTIVKNGIIQSIETALDNMRPASLSFGRGQTNIGHNRSSADNETPYDKDVDVVKVIYKNSAQPALLFLTGCHPVFPNDQAQGFTISANFPGVARRMLEQKADAATALFIQGCAGDINPRNANDRETGMELALDVMSVLQQDLKKITGNITYAMDTVNVPVEPMTEQQVIQFKNENINKEGNVGAEKNVRWADIMLDRYRRGDMPASLPVYVQTINIGNWKLVGLSREVVTEYGTGIKKLWPAKMVSVAGYCNDVSSYLPAERHIVNKTYEGIDSFFWYAEPAVFPADVLEIVVRQIRARNR